MTIPAGFPQEQTPGNGSTTIFAFPHLFFENAHLRVTELDLTTKVETIISAGITKNGAGDPAGGNVTYDVAPDSNTRITLDLDVPLAQQAKYPTNEGFPSTAHEVQMDKQVQMLQGQDVKFAKTLQFITSLLTAFDPVIQGEPTAKKGFIVTDDGLGVRVSTVNLEEVATSASADAAAAAVSAAAALVSENNSSTSEANAATSETNAATSETNAAQSATDAAASASAAKPGINILADNVEWDVTTTTQIVVKAGGVAVGVVKTTKDTLVSATVDITNDLDQGTEASNTWYALVMLIDSNVVNAPIYKLVTAANYPGSIVLPGTHDDYKRIGWVRNDGNLDLILGEFNQNGPYEFVYHKTPSSQPTQSSTSFANLDLSEVIPPTSQYAVVRADPQGTASVWAWRAPGSADTTDHTNTTDTDTTEQVQVMVSTTQQLSSKVDVSSIKFNTLFYRDNLQKDS